MTLDETKANFANESGMIKRTLRSDLREASTRVLSRRSRAGTGEIGGLGAREAVFFQFESAWFDPQERDACEVKGRGAGGAFSYSQRFGGKGRFGLARKGVVAKARQETSGIKAVPPQNGFPAKQLFSLTSLGKSGRKSHFGTIRGYNGAE